MSMSNSAAENPPQPWAAFFDELDCLLEEPVQLHCVGGFVLTTVYQLPRVTGDCDYVAALGGWTHLETLAGPNSPLHKKHKVYLQRVSVTTMPENYQSRLSELFPTRFKRFRIFVPDVYDLILSKVERNSPKDNEDVQYLVRTVPLESAVLRDRYREEQRPYFLSRHDWHDKTVQMWIDAYFHDTTDLSSGTGQA